MDSQTIEISVNGAAQRVALGGNVSTLLRFLGVESDRVAVEMDRTIVRKRDWDQTPVVGGSQIEIVEFVGGG